MRMGAVAIVLVSVAACGAPEGSDPTSWAVRLTTARPSTSQSQVIADRMASTDPLDTVWGAYLAGELGLSSLAETLSGLTQDGPLLRGAALDALARVGGSVPDARLRELMETDAMTAMAIALQEPGAHRDLIFDAFVAAHDALPRAIEDTFASAEVTHWRAYANALAWLRDRELAAILLASLEATIDVEVVSPGDFIAGVGCRCGGVFGTSCRAYSYQPFTALPPVGTWSIREADDDACVVLLPGPTDVCLARVESKLQQDMRERALAGLPLRQWVSSIGHDAQLEAMEADETPEEEEAAENEPDTPEELTADEPESPPNEARQACPDDAAIADSEIETVPSVLNDELMAYLSLLQNEDVSFGGRLSLRHVWTGEDAYRSEIEALRERIRTAHTGLARALADAYLLPDGYRPPRLAVTVSVRDERTCGATLPVPRL